MVESFYGGGMTGLGSREEVNSYRASVGLPALSRAEYAQYVVGPEPWVFDAASPDYDAEKYYLARAAVRYSGSFWLSKQPSLGVTPGANPEVWIKLLDGIDIAQYDQLLSDVESIKQQAEIDAQALIDEAATARLASEAAQGAAQTARSGAEAARDEAEFIASQAQAAALTCATWAALAALTGSYAGQGAEVLDTDAGTHTDPVAGGTVANGGRYSWSTSPAGWLRIGDTGLSSKAAQAALDAEVAARRDVVRESADRGLVVKDRLRRVLARISGDGISVMGRWRLMRSGEGLRLLDGARRVGFAANDREIRIGGRLVLARSGEGLKVMDRLRRVLLRVQADGIWFMGRQILTSENLPELLTGWVRDQAALYRPEVRPLPVWRRARAGATAGVMHARVGCLGDSNTMGWAAMGVGLHRRFASYPDAMARALPGAMAARADAYLGGNGISAWPDYDPRINLGAGWDDNGAVSLGGEAFRNTTTTNPLTFTPSRAWQRADVWVKLPGAASLSVGVAGYLETHVPAPGSIIKLTYDAPALAVQPLQIVRVSGDVQVVGWDVYDPAAGGVGILNGGRSGWRSDQYAAVAADVAALDLDLAIIQLGLNDFRQNIAPSVYAGHMTALIDAVIATGSDVVLMISFTPSGGQTYQWADYVAQVYALADHYGLPVIDLGARLGEYTEAVAGGWTSDGTHLNTHGYAEAGWLAAQLLTQ